MSSTTPNLGLTKTTAAETIGQNWAASNDSGGNFDIIDTKMGAVGNTSLQAQVTALNSNLSPISDDYTKRITPFYSPNSGNNVATITFNGLTANEGVNLMLFTRYGSHVMTLTVDANSKISAYDVQKLTGTNTLTVTISADGKSISFHVGNYSALCGLFIHPHYPNATLTVTRSAS